MTNPKFDIQVGKVLISEPFLPDPNFRRTVVLITDYGNHGTIGFVINQVTDYAVNMLLLELPGINTSAYQGGPVELESFHYIHRYSHIAKSSKIMDGVYWSGDFEEIHSGLKDNTLHAEDFKFFIGYSGWAPGQLEQELEEKSWLIGDLDPNLLFDTTIADSDLWKHAIRGMGGTHALLANSPIDPNLN